MLDFSNTDGHSNSIEFVDNDDIDAVNWYVFACFYEQLASSSYRHFFGKGSVTTSAGYWPGGMGNGASSRIVARHHDGTAATPLYNPTAAFFSVDSTVHSMVVAYDETGNWLRAYQDGVLFDSEFSMTRDIAGNANVLRLGDAGDLGGAPVKLGHVMLWTGQQAAIPFTKSQVDAMAALYHVGEAVPQPGFLKYWIKGDNATTVVNEISQEVGTENGTVTMTADAVDAYFKGETYVPMHREVASREIRRSRFAGLVHHAPVGPAAAEWELGDGINYSHWGIPRADSLTSDRENDGMVKTGQPSYCFLSGTRFQPSTRDHTLMLEELEHVVATFWSTFKLPGSIDTQRDGLAQIDTGAEKTFERSNPAWIPQEGDQLATVGAGLEKMNDEGFWSEDSRTNLIEPSRVWTATGAVGWTDNSGTGGTVDPAFSATIYLFKDLDNYPDYMIQVRRDAGTDDVYITAPDVSVTASGTPFNRVQFWHTEVNVGSTVGQMNWRLQRGSDSGYWADSTGSWSTGSVWNALPVRDIDVDYSGVIEATGSDTWTLDVGLAGSATGAFLVGEVDIQNSRYALSPLVTSTGSTTISLADSLAFAINSDATRQIVYAARNTIRVTFVAKQDAGNMADDDIFTIFYAQFGSTVANYLAGYYEKPSGGNARFVYEMQRSSSVDAQAVYEIDIVAGTSYEVMFRLTDNSGDELGLKARTLSVLVDGVRGTDAQASGDLSTAEAQTELWWGYADSSLGWLRCNNVLADADVQQRAVPDEEALALR